jgi:dTDP-4-dehydrorhamnose 3,5-epimerase
VIVDLRQDSPTYREHVGFELSAENRRALYVPIGFAHGFQTLTDDSEVFYQMSGPYVAETHRAYRFDDPAFGIDWPLTVSALSDRDARAPCLGDGTP